MPISGLEKLRSNRHNSLTMVSVTEWLKVIGIFSNVVAQLNNFRSSQPSDLYFLEVIQQQVLSFPILLLTIFCPKITTHSGFLIFFKFDKIYR
jgi:hypothetical protein